MSPEACSARRSNRHHLWLQVRGLRLHPAVHGWARTPHFDQEIVLGPEARWKRSARARSFVVEA